MMKNTVRVGSFMHDLAIRRSTDVGALALISNGKGRRYSGPDVVEVHQHSVAKALDEATFVGRKDISLHALDEIEPIRDDANLVLIDKTD